MNENPYLNYCSWNGRIYTVMAQSQNQYTRFVKEGDTGCKIRPYCEYDCRINPLFHLCGEPEPDLPDTKNRNEHIGNLRHGAEKVKKEVSLSKKVTLHKRMR